MQLKTVMMNDLKASKHWGRLHKVTYYTVNQKQHRNSNILAALSYSIIT